MAANDNFNQSPTLRGPNGGPFISPEHIATEVNRRLDIFFAKLGLLDKGAPFLHPFDTD